MARRKTADADSLTLADLAVLLSPQHLYDSLDSAIERLRESVSADSTSLYLANPQGTELTLAVCSPLPTSETLRVQVGQGPLGLAALERMTISGRPSTRSFVAIPLTYGARLLGLLVAAWHNATPVPPTAVPLLEKAANPLGTTILAGISALSSQVAELFRGQSTEPLRLLTQLIQGLSQASDSSLSLVNGQRTPGCTLENCPLWQRDSPLLLTLDEPWPAACMRNGHPTATKTCVPMGIPSGWLGVLGLTYAEDAPSPPTRYVAMLQALVQEAAYHLPKPTGTPIPGSPRLSIQCLGGLTIYRDGRRIVDAAFKRKSARQLLKILLLSNGTMLHRDALCEMLWPGVNGDRGVNRLHGVVYALRQALQDPDCVQSTGDRYGFEVGPDIYVDFLHFRQLIAQARTLERQATSHSEAITCLETACELYHGDLFEDDPYAEWCWPQREALHNEYFESLLWLARLWTQQGDTERSLEYYRQALRCNPLCEDVHRSLIRTLWTMGRRQDALLQYGMCVDALRRELDAAPMPETLQLYAEITA